MSTKLNVKVYGQLEDITGSGIISTENVPDTDLLLEKLYAQYPLLKTKKFLIAINKKIITGKTEIDGKADIVLLPPFSGG